MRSENKTNGRWTKKEHEQFLMGLQIYGKNWKKIEQIIPTRTGSQIRSHAQKHFLKDGKIHCDYAYDEIPEYQNQLTNSQNSNNSKSIFKEYTINLDGDSSFFASQLQHYLLLETKFWNQCIDTPQNKNINILHQSNDNNQQKYIQPKSNSSFKPFKFDIPSSKTPDAQKIKFFQTESSLIFEQRKQNNGIPQFILQKMSPILY